LRQAYDYWQNQPDCYRTSHLFGAGADFDKSGSEPVGTQTRT